MLFALLAVSALVPSALLMWFFHARDLFREPPRVLWATFGLGVLTIPGVLLVVLPVSAVLGMDEVRDPFLWATVQAFGSAAIPEELFKLAVVLGYAARHDAFDEPMDGIVYGVAASLGFATLENVLYVAGGGIGTAILRALTAVPGHAFWGVLMGYFVAQAKFRPAERGRLLAGAVLVPIVLHGVYDLGLMLVSRLNDLEREVDAVAITALVLSLVALLVSIVWGLRVSAGLRLAQLELRRREIVDGGVPSAAVPPVALGEGKPSHAVTLLMLLPGALLSVLGSLLTLGLGLGLLLGSTTGDELKGLVVMLVIAGVVPFGGGVALFMAGVRRLNRASAWQAWEQGAQPAFAAPAPPWR